MSVSFRPFVASDLFQIDVQDRHKWVLTAMQGRPLLAGLLENEWAWTASVGGSVLCCAGAVDSEMWCFLAHDLRRYMLPITRFGRAMMDAHLATVGRLWAHIDPDHPEAVRWAQLGGLRHVEGWLWVLDAHSL